MANKRMYTYIVGLGFEGCVFERHEVKAANESEAYYMGARMLDPSKGYNYITTKRIYKNGGKANEKR